MNDIRLGPFAPTLQDETARMLARAFVTNPLHVEAFGVGALTRNEAFFRTALGVMKGPRHVAYDEDRLSGFVHWVHSSGCQHSVAEKARLLPAMVSGLGLRSSLRLVRWLSAWSNLDPKEAHLHLGPIGVDPRAQGRGVGARLMGLYCDELERGALSGYLETDRPENVTFYERFGFEVVSEEQVLGVRNFFMRRP